MNESIYTLVSETGTDRAHHVTDEKAPVYRFADAATTFATGGIVELPDGTHAYVQELTGELGLYRKLLAVDAGSNVHAERNAPEPRTAIATRPRGIGDPLTVVGADLVGWLE